METESQQFLLHDKQVKRWSTWQLILICSVVVVIAVLATNVDRIIDALSKSSSSSSPRKPFGHEMYDYFDFNQDVALNFNWGSFGGYPSSIIEQVSELQHTMQQNINFWQIWTRTSAQMSVLQTFAEYIGVSNWLDLVFVDNASHGVNAVIRSLSQYLYSNTCRNNTDPTKICKILQFNTAYEMVPEALHWINSNINSPQNQLLTFDFDIEMLNNTTFLIQNLNEFIQNEYIQSNNTTIIYMAVLSHITAFPACLLDIKSINERVFKPHGIISVIDAAHSLGQVKINIDEMDPDIFIATGYKWMHAPRGSGLLYVRNSLQHLIEPTVTSNLGGGPTAFQARFSYSGTKDYTPWLAMNYALDWRRTVVTDDSDDAIIDYLHYLAYDGAHLIADLWNTSVVIENEERIAGMSNIVFLTQNESEVMMISNGLIFGDESYPTWSRIEMGIDGVVSARLCAQIFLDLTDYQYYGERVIQLLESIKS